MAKGASASNAGQGSRPSGSPVIVGGNSGNKGYNRYSKGSGVSRTSAGGAGGAGGMIRFGFNDDAPGIEVSPNAVLVLTLLYVGIVILLHIWSKFY